MPKSTEQRTFQNNTIELISKYQARIKDPLAIVNSSRKGVKVNAFFDLAIITGFKKDKLADDLLGISIKTLMRYRQDEKKLSPQSSEMVLKLIALYQKGVALFSEIKYFNNWLNKPAFGLGMQIPYDLINTSTGIDLIFEELLRIEHGDLA